MADALGSGPSGLYARGGSSPLARTNYKGARISGRLLIYKDCSIYWVHDKFMSK